MSNQDQPSSPSQREPPDGGRIVIGVAIAVAVAMLVLPSIDWPQALAGVVAVTIAALLAGRRRDGVATAVPPAAPIPPPIDLRVEGIVTAVGQPLILSDRKLVVRAFNGGAAGLVPGLRRGEPLTMSLRVPDLIEAVRAVAADGGERVVIYSERVPVERWFRVVVSAARVTAAARDGGLPDFVLILLSDMTEEQRLSRLRADFVANASHELRTPLASLMGFIETIQGPARNDPAARDRFLAIMLAQGQRMSRLIDDLLSLSRVELNEHVRPVGEVDLVNLVGQVRDVLQPQARDSGVDLRLESVSPSVVVTGDRDELFRLVENLLQNAIRYGASGGRVEVTIRREARGEGRSQAVLTIRDFGPGIAPEHLPRLTERFYRVDEGASREKGGTGLGLAIVKHIINRHQGRLTIESTPGAGATFAVWLPEPVAESP